MKFKKRKGLYEASNVTLDPITLNAYSYRWWRFLAKVEGRLVFNNYGYSNSTVRHQWKVRAVLRELGVAPDFYLPLPKGINSESLEDLIVLAEEHLCDKFLSEKLKAQERYQKTKAKKLELKLRDQIEDMLNGPAPQKFPPLQLVTA